MCCYRRVLGVDEGTQRQEAEALVEAAKAEVERLRALASEAVRTSKRAQEASDEVRPLWTRTLHGVCSENHGILLKQGLRIRKLVVEDSLSCDDEVEFGVPSLSLLHRR